jgi:hypothetical protein
MEVFEAEPIVKILSIDGGGIRGLCRPAAGVKRTRRP